MKYLLIFLWTLFLNILDSIGYLWIMLLIFKNILFYFFCYKFLFFPVTLTGNWQKFSTFLQKTFPEWQMILLKGQDHEKNTSHTSEFTLVWYSVKMLCFCFFYPLDIKTCFILSPRPHMNLRAVCPLHIHIANNMRSALYSQDTIFSSKFENEGFFIAKLCPKICCWRRNSEYSIHSTYSSVYSSEQCILNSSLLKYPYLPN